MKLAVVITALGLGACAGAGELPGGVSDTPVTLAAPVVLTSLPVPPPTAGGSTGSSMEWRVFTVGDLWALHDDFVVCLSTPPACDVASIAAEGSPAHADLSRLLEVRRRDGLWASAPSTPVQRQLGRLWWGSGSASAQWCWVDDLVLLDMSRGASSPIIVDDTEVALDEVWTLRLVGDKWLLTQRHTTRRAQGVTSWCG